ncbi:TPA: AAA family ATPase [Vibrio parahaemolyticus]
MIRQITITNFRSIRKETISTEEITTLVGKNDAGKSNLLRALNLFFNGKLMQILPTVSSLILISTRSFSNERQKKSK